MGPSVFRDPSAPLKPGGIIITVEDYKGRNVVDFSTVPLPLKRTRGPNKHRPVSDLALSDEEEVDTTFRSRKASRARLNKKSKNPRENSEPTNTSSKELTRREKISTTMLQKRDPATRSPLTPAERKRNQRKLQSKMKKEKELTENRLRNQLQREKKKEER
jgi:hypothetical protein